MLKSSDEMNLERATRIYDAAEQVLRDAQETFPFVYGADGSVELSPEVGFGPDLFRAYEGLMDAHGDLLRLHLDDLINTNQVRDAKVMTLRKSIEYHLEPIRSTVYDRLSQSLNGED